MSIDLICPNCGGVVGHADSSDNYQQKWLKSDKNGEPVCPHCGAGREMQNFERNLLIGVAILIVLIPIAIFLTTI